MNTQANKVTWLLCTESLVDTQANHWTLFVAPRHVRKLRIHVGVPGVVGVVSFVCMGQCDILIFGTEISGRDLHVLCISCVMLISDISVARGEGARGGNFLPPPPKLIRSLVYMYNMKICWYGHKPTSMSFVLVIKVSVKVSKYQQNIKRNNSFRMWKCKNFL